MITIGLHTPTNSEFNNGSSRASPHPLGRTPHRLQCSVLHPRRQPLQHATSRAAGLTLNRHPLALLRPRLHAQRFLPADLLNACGDGQFARGCGIVTMRQRPPTAKGVLFLTIEDETGATNVIVRPALVEKQRREVLGSTLLGVYGIWWPNAWWICRICWAA